VVASVADLVDDVTVGSDGVHAATDAEVLETAIARAGLLRDEVGSPALGGTRGATCLGRPSPGASRRARAVRR
jgi:hypothetical protein